ncbi:MAG: iron(III) transport system permease protein [Arenicella sp.]
MKSNFLKSNQLNRLFNGWTVGFFVIFGLLVFPIGYIIWHLFEPSSDSWKHISENLLLGYTINSMILTLGVGALTALFGIPTAWFVSTTDFPLRKQFEWALMMPLAIPTYIIAFVYADMFSYTGTFQKAYQAIFDSAIPFDIMTKGGAILVMSSVLFPYVYMMARTSFGSQSQTLIEASKLLGKSNFTTFFRVALPLARPAIFGALFLIMMDVLNEYGTVKYYGISTFTTGIFKAWLSMGDTSSAIRLSACLLVFVLILILLERWQRGKISFAESSKSQKPIRREKLKGFWAVVASLVCLIPLSIGFLIPITQILFWCVETAEKVVDARFLSWIWNSLTLGIVTAFVAIFVSIILVYSVRISKSAWMQKLSKIAVLGYAIPGAIIAVGILASFTQLDKQLINWWATISNQKIGLILTGTIMALVFAYTIRFLAVSFNSIEASFEKVAGNLDEASRTLGAGTWRTLFRVNLPILKPTLFSAGLMVFVEVMKELPLTLILRPFNFDTLSTKAYEMASDELIREASSASLLIVLIGMIPVVLVVWFQKR